MPTEAAMESDPLSAALRRDDAAWAREHLATDVVGWLTTVGADGMPQSSLISFLWETDTILVYSQPDTPKLRNIAGSPLVAFNLQSDAYGDHMLIVEGTATVDRSAPPSDEHPAYTAKYAEAYAHWEMDPVQAARDFSVAIRITPRRVRVA
jgi:PPOX class probable F420-dependent enzyme